MTSQRTRERLVQRLVAEGIRNRSVLQAIRNIPRHIFVEEALASRAYEDTALPIGYGQTISQPYIVARMTEALIEGGRPRTVLEIGTGSGYQTAILATLVDRVYSVERIEPFVRQARRRFQELRLHNIRLKYTDGSIGLPEYAPFEGILVTAAPEHLPTELLKQMAVGGRMVLPVGSGRRQSLVRIFRTPSGYESEELESVSFVPLVGGVE